VAVAVSVTRIVGGGGFRDDDVFKMVAILPVAVVGAGLLYRAALRAHSGQKLVGWGLVLLVGLLVGGLALLFVFVLSYAISMYGSEPSGRWPILWEPPWYGKAGFSLFIACVVAYLLTLVEIGIVSVLLVRIVFRYGKHMNARRSAT